MRRQIDAIEADRLLNTSAEDLCLFFVEEYSIDVPILDEKSIAVDQHETQVDVSGDPRRYVTDRSRPFYVLGTTVEADVPFTGDASMFHIRPSTFTFNPPRAQLRGDSVLRIHVVGAELDSERVHPIVAVR